MNYLIEIVIFNVVIYTICGINMAKKGKLGFLSDTYFCRRYWHIASAVHVRSLKDGFTDILCW